MNPYDYPNILRFMNLTMSDYWGAVIDGDGNRHEQSEMSIQEFLEQYPADFLQSFEDWAANLNDHQLMMLPSDGDEGDFEPGEFVRWHHSPNPIGFASFSQQMWHEFIENGSTEPPEKLHYVGVNSMIVTPIDLRYSGEAPKGGVHRPASIHVTDLNGESGYFVPREAVHAAVDKLGWLIALAEPGSHQEKIAVAALRLLGCPSSPEEIRDPEGHFANGMGQLPLNRHDSPKGVV